MLWDEMLRASTLEREFWEWDGSRYAKRSFGEIVASARHVAAGLHARGVGPGSTVAAVITNGPDAAAGHLGVWFAGATLASLPIIARGMTLDRYVAQLDRLCQLVGSRHLLAEERFLALMSDEHPLQVDTLGYRALADTPAAAEVQPPPLEHTAFVQFSSGTTGEPRGVQLSGVAIEEQLRMLANHLHIDPRHDCGYMWLPMSHDMGFFGCWLLAWYTGMVGAKSTPERFLREPGSWMDDCAEFGATVTAGPPFALRLAAGAQRRRPSPARVQLRLCLVGAEQIGWETMVGATDALEARGLALESVTTAYGLAEATLAVTTGRPERAPGYVDVDGKALAAGELRVLADGDPAARRVVSCGAPVPGAEVRCDPRSGEIVIRSSSLASSYHGDPATTAARFRDGELWTGDIGFVHEGELFVTGRVDDMVVFGGRNVHVQEIEDALCEEPGVRRGNCAIVSGLGDELHGVGVVAERDTDTGDARELALRLRKVTIEASGVPVELVVFLPKGLFPKTPSGKVQRFRCRQIVSEGHVGTRVRLAS